MQPKRGVSEQVIDDEKLEKATKNMSSLTDGQRKAALAGVDRMKETAKELREAVDKGADASGELALLASTVADLESFLSRAGLSGTLTSWAGLKGNLARAQSAFGVATAS